jgi:hypothetical protein
VQTGFEIWDLPADRGASQSGALGTTPFSVTPLSVLANDPKGVTGRARAVNSPIIHWYDLFTVKHTACHDTSTLTGTVPSCPSDNLVNMPVFIDPGKSLTTNLLPVKGAAGPHAPASAGNIPPTTNLETTDANGSFRRDVIPGSSEVQAPAPPGGDGGGDGLPADVVMRPPGITQQRGFTVTTDTGSAGEWNTAFPVPKGSINQAWNMVLRADGQPGDVHANPSNLRNTMSQPGASTFSTTSCAVP